MRTRALLVRTPGGPEALKWDTIDVGDPAGGQVRIRHTAIGVNFIDTYHRSGLYPIDPPFVPGLEGVGVVEQIGDGSGGFEVGDRVAYADALGAYCERRVVPVASLVRVPDALDDAFVASSLLRGLTAHYLIHRTAQIGPGQWILVHAAAGGVGQLLSSWARSLGARVIGTAGSAEKRDLAFRHGCQFAIEYRRENFADRVLEITDGRGVDVVYDGVGAATFEESLRALRPLGLMVSFGNASGPVPPIAPLRLAEKGLFLTRPKLKHHIATRADLEAAAERLFAAIESGEATAEPPDRHPLHEAAEVHRLLESRATAGGVVLIPQDPEGGPA